MMKLAALVWCASVLAIVSCSDDSSSHKDDAIGGAAGQDSTSEGGTTAEPAGGSAGESSSDVQAAGSDAGSGSGGEAGQGVQSGEPTIFCTAYAARADGTPDSIGIHRYSRVVVADSIVKNCTDEDCTVLSYDGEGQLVRIARKRAIFDYTYDSTGRLSKLVVTASEAYKTAQTATNGPLVANYSYDDQGRVSKIVEGYANFEPGTTTYSYGTGRLPKTSDSDTSHSVYTYDAAQRLISVVTTGPTLG
ncbi:MAG TPA: hypothetical protein VGC79_14695, partial [Polyangiaceae bacterium]